MVVVLFVVLLLLAFGVLHYDQGRLPFDNSPRGYIPHFRWGSVEARERRYGESISAIYTAPRNPALDGVLVGTLRTGLRR